jgi:hypothetical protein
MAPTPRDPAAASDVPEVDDSTRLRELSGMTNVAALTFLAARAVPLGWIVAVAGGVPLARAAQRHGGRAGYAAATAGLVETMAVMGPARMGIPVPHAASAPLLGVLVRRGRSLAALALAGAAVRSAYYVATSAFSILVLIGLDAYLGSYEQLREWLPFLPAGRGSALWITFALLLLWSLGAGLIQATVIRRGLRCWDIGTDSDSDDLDPPRSRTGRTPIAHPHAGSLTVLALLGFAITLSGTDARLLGIVGAALGIAWIVTRADARALRWGLLLALPLALSTFAFGAVGGIGIAVALRRAMRVALLVLIAVWLHHAAGGEGLRAQALRVVHLLRRFRTLALAAAVLGASVSSADFGGAARRLGHRLRNAKRRPTPVLDASLAWLADESHRLAAAEPTKGDPPEEI